MLLSKTMEEAIREKDVKKIYSSFYTILLSDPGFETGSFDEVYTFVKAQNIPGFLQAHNGDKLEAETSWNQEYWDRLASELMDNFSEERVGFLKKVGQKVYQKKTPFVQTETYRKKQQTEVLAVPQKPRQNGKLIVMITVAIVLLILLLVLFL